MDRKFLESYKVVHVPPNDGAATTYPLAGGTSDVNSVAVDSFGFGSICFLAMFGDNADTGAFTWKIQGSANGTTNWTDISGATGTFTAAASDTDFEMLGLECSVDPNYRYYRIALNRETANTVLADVIAVLGQAMLKPVVQLTTAGQFIAAPVII